MSRILQAILGGTFFLYLFSLPLSITGLEMFSWLSVILFCFALLFKNPYFLASSKQFNFKRIYWALPFIGVILLEILLAPNIPKKHQFYIIGELRWGVLLFFLPVLLFHFWSKGEKVFSILCAILTLSASYAIIQSLTSLDLLSDSDYFPLRSGGLWRAKGLLEIMTYSHSISMLFLFVYSTILLNWGNKKWLIPCAILIGVSLILTFTRGMWLSLSIATITITFIVHRQKALHLIGIGVGLISVLVLTVDKIQHRLLLTFNFSDSSTSARFQLWKANWNIFLDHPFFGVGFQRNKVHLPQYYKSLGIEDGMISHAHSNYFSVLAGTGLFGFIAYLVFAFGFFKIASSLWRNHRYLPLFDQVIVLGSLGALINFHIGGLTECNYLDAEVFHTYIIVLSLLIAVLNRYEKQSNYSTL